METITVKNRTTLTDFSALIRVGLYLSGDIEEATKHGFSFKVAGNGNRTIVTIKEEPEGTTLPTDSGN